MAAAWDASTNGGMLAYIIRREGLVTDEVRDVVAQHRKALRSAGAAARQAGHQGDARLQDLDADYAAALAALAADLKALVPNPFTA